MTAKRLLLPLLVLGSLLAAAPAQAAYTVGIGDQQPGMFANKLWKDLKLKKVRYVTPWDTAQDPSQNAEADRYLTAARAAKQEVLVHFSARRGCFTGRSYRKTTACKAPTVAKYTSAFKAFKKAYPFVKVYGVWNEANHVSQPLNLKNSKNRGPKINAQYYAALKKNCKRCKIVAGDLLDTSDLEKYAKALNKALKGRARIFGLHNYGDVNRNRTSGTRAALRLLPGELWLTETGGIVKFEAATRGLRPSERNADKSLKRMFALAAKYDSRTRGNKSRITRLYPYNFQEQPGARFDAGLVDPEGEPRKGYFTFKKAAARAKR
jgi:hypothetical protein